MNERLNELGLDKKQLAELLGISPKRANNLLLGREQLSQDQVAKLSKEFNVSASNFIEFNEELP
jgi:plasmid maintenance system antidote protein VapI